MKHLQGFLLWQYFENAELTEVVRQINKLFIDQPNKVRIGNTNDEKLLDLDMNLMKTTKTMLSTCRKRNNKL